MFFFFNDTATTEIYTLSLHDALPISPNNNVGNHIFEGLVTKDARGRLIPALAESWRTVDDLTWEFRLDRKSTRLNSSHANISYAVFCLKKKKEKLMLTLTSPPYTFAP